MSSGNSHMRSFYLASCSLPSSCRMIRRGDSTCHGNTQGLQGAAPGNHLIEHLVHRFLMVRSRLEFGVILEVREERKGNLIAHGRNLHLRHHQPEVLYGAHATDAAISDKAGRLVVPLAEE